MLSLFRLDYRSLAALRVVLGFVLLFDLINYWDIAHIYLSDDGIMSRAVYLQQKANPWNWSLLYSSGSAYFIYAFLFWHGLTLFFFIFGFKTRLNTFFLWLQIVSMHNRNWIVTNGGDELVRCCLILLIFLPLGKVFSIDSKDKKYEDDFNFNYNSSFNLALYLQLGIMYFGSAVFKDHPIWNRDYSALHYVLSLDLFVRPFGAWLKNQDYLISPLTAMAYYFEFYGPFIILLGLFKKFHDFSRYLLVISFLGFHLFIDTIINVGTFPYFAIALWFAFIPSHFWDHLVIHDKVNRFFNQFLSFLNLTYQKTIAFRYWPRKKILLNSLGVFFIINLLSWTLNDEKFSFNLGQKYLPRFLLTTNRWFATYQNWHLFAPYPKKNNLWIEFTGTLDTDEKVDLFRGTYKTFPISSEEVREFYSIEKWRKIFSKAESSPNLRDGIAQYYCRTWDSLSAAQYNFKRLKQVELIYHHQITADRGIASGQHKEKVLTTYSCY